MFSQDRDFEEALEDPDVLEKRLEALRKDRKRASWVGAFSSAVFFFSVFVSLLGYHKSQQLGMPAIIAPLMLFGSLQQLSALVLSQNDIRILLAFKRLRELQSPN